MFSTGRSFLIAMFCGRVISIVASFAPYFHRQEPLVIEANPTIRRTMLGNDIID
jgi:hypothetical protein